MPRAIDDPCDKYVGLTEAEAENKVRDDGKEPRITGRDGKAFIVTRDYRTDRVNLVIVDGKVISAKLG